MKNEIKITFVKSPEEGEICAVFVNEFWDRSKTKLTVICTSDNTPAALLTF